MGSGGNFIQAVLIFVKLLAILCEILYHVNMEHTIYHTERRYPYANVRPHSENKTA